MKRERKSKGHLKIVKSEASFSSDEDSSLLKDKHLEGFDEDEKNTIRLIAKIFVGSIISKVNQQQAA